MPLDEQRGGATLSRRAFVGGSAGLCAASCATLLFGGVSVAGLGGCAAGDGDEEFEVLTVSEDDVVTLDSFTNYTNASRHYSLATLGTYNAGTLLHSASGSVCAAICQADTANPLNELAVVGLTSGTIATLRTQAVGHDEGYCFLSASASDTLLVWVESNFLTARWRVYCAELDADTLRMGQAIELDSGDADEYDAPEIEALGSTAYWVVQPAQDGSKTAEDSYLKASAGGAEPVTVHTSHGRFNGGLSVSGGVLTAMPRLDTSGVYYQLTAFEGGTGTILATQVMPQSFKPSTAVYLNDRFAFTIGASYDYGGGIANVGTYYPLDDGTYLRLTKQPVAAPGLCRGWLFSKSGSRTVLVDLENRGYITVDAPEGSADYGDFPIFAGKHKHVFVYASVTDDESSSTNVLLRRITPN